MAASVELNNAEVMQTVNALESPHIKPETSRRKGRKRPAEGDIDNREQTRARLDLEESPSNNLANGLDGTTRTASEEIMDPAAATSGATDNDSGDEKDVVDGGDGAIGGGAATCLPKPEQMAPLAESMTDENGQPLSKNQAKKRRKQAQWEAKANERKIIRKEKLVAKRERKREARQQAVGEDGQPALPLRRPTKAQRTQVPVAFLIDCDFDDLMLDKERKSLASQVTRCYSDTRKAMIHPHLAVCSFSGELKERFNTVLSHYKGWKGICFIEDDFVATAQQARQWMSDTGKNKLAGSFTTLSSENPDEPGKLQEEGEVVYLTSESPHTLTSLKPYSTYIIGGLVDKNREKGICYRRATERGVKTAKLPIGEFMEMNSRKVLATNHVNEIMLKWLECGDWGEAFMQVIPKRKGGKLKGEGGHDEEDEDGEEEEDVGPEDGLDGGTAMISKDAAVAEGQSGTNEAENHRNVAFA